MATSAHSVFFIRKLLIVFLLSCFALVSTGCGDESFTTNTTENNPPPEDPDTDPDPGSSPSPSPTPTPPPTSAGSSVASVILWASASTLGSGSSNSIELTALAKNEVNRLVEGANISFESTGGGLQVMQESTTVAGVATAILSSSGDPTNRRITVTAASGAITDEIQIDVVGSSISIIGPSALTLGDEVGYTIQLNDSDGNGIPFEAVDIVSSNNSILTPAPFTTDASGKLSLILSAQQNGVLTANALNNSVSANQPLTVTTDRYLLSIAQLNANQTEMDIGQNYTIQLSWSDDTGPKAGETINFSATRGLVVPTTVQTDANGETSVQISSTSSGPTLITAEADNGPSSSLDLEFVAISPNTLTLQAGQTTIGPNGEESALTAIIRDPNNNLVKNQLVRFTIMDDTSGGNISNATDVTDSLGRANTVYISSESTSAKDGVWIRAQLDGVGCPAVDQPYDLCEDIYLTVAEKKLFVRLGTSNQMEVLDATRYKALYNALVTDAAGNAVPDAEVSLSVIPTNYYTGCRVWDDSTNRYYTEQELKRPNEDVNLNGILDAGEDVVNTNGVLDPGNVASVPATLTTDSTGFAIIEVVYAKNYAGYVEILLTATTEVAGTETSDSIVEDLPILLADARTRGTVPGPVSKWGASDFCGGLTVLAVPGANSGEIEISWIPTPNVDSYNLYWSTNAGDGIGGTQIADVTSTYTHSGLTPGVTYYYTVTAVVGATESQYSRSASAVARLPAPGNLVVNPSATTGGIDLSWDAVAGANYYLINWSTIANTGIGGVEIRIPATQTSYRHSGLTTGQSYFYVVRATTGGFEGEGLQTPELTAVAP